MSRRTKCGTPSESTLCEKCGEKCGEKEQRQVEIAAIFIFGTIGILALGSFVLIAVGVGKAFWGMN